MPNYLYPDALSDIAYAFIRGGGVELPEDLDRALERAIVRHFRTDDGNSVLARDRPRTQPDWAYGKILAHPVPKPELSDEVTRIARFLARARAAVTKGHLKSPDSTLHEQLAAVPRSIPHDDWQSLVYQCDQLNDRLDIFEAAQVRAWTRQIIPLSRGMRWRRLRSGQELWAAASGTRWCVRKGYTFNDMYIQELSSRDLAFWVLEQDRQSLALVSYRPDTGEIDQAKDREGRAPVAHRNSVRKLCEHLGHEASRFDCADMLALAFDEDLGRRKQTRWEGELETGPAKMLVRYRLWSDGRRKKYLIGLTLSSRRSPTFYLKLTLDQNGKTGVLSGTAPPSITLAPANLMANVLGQIVDSQPREHWKSARRVARRLAQSG